MTVIVGLASSRRRVGRERRYNPQTAHTNGFRLENNTAEQGKAIIGGSVVGYPDDIVDRVGGIRRNHARSDLSAFDTIKSQLVSPPTTSN
jgi:hypothetical protein